MIFIQILPLLLAAILSNYRKISPSLFLIATSLLLQQPKSASASPIQPLSREIHIVEKDESLSSILLKRGIGSSGSPWKLYGKFGFLNLIFRHNPQIEDPKNLKVGTQLVLVLPENLATTDDKKLRVRMSSGGKSYELKWFLHEVKRKETLSGILYSYGIGTPSAVFRIFGSNRWLSRLTDINHIQPDDTLQAGQNLIVEVPKEIQVEQLPPVEILLPLVVTKETPIEVIVTLSSEEIEKLSPKLLGEKLTTEKIAQMTTAEAKKIPATVKEEKAWDYSFMDVTSEKTGNFFEGMKKTSASVYLGLRYGVSVVKPGDASLARRLSLYGILAEFRGGPLSGARLYYDLLPTARAKVSGETQRIGLRRYLVGWGFGTGPLGFIDNIHLAPKFGRYRVEANLDIREKFEEKPEIQELRIKNGVATGIEADLEWARFFYVLRLWAGADTSRITIFGKPKESVTSQRAGLDLFLKGPGFTTFDRKMSLQYLVFGAKENLSLFSPQKKDDEAEILVEVSFIGAGLSLSW